MLAGVAQSKGISHKGGAWAESGRGGRSNEAGVGLTQLALVKSHMARKGRGISMC